MRALTIVLLVIWALPAALAKDGAVEINQACAEGPGCFPGDEPGFPVRITESGSYTLTSNLTVPELVDGLTTEAAGGGFPDGLSVTINLNGFRISSTTTCSGDPLNCAPASTEAGFGIHFSPPEHGSMLVYNGTVKGMAGTGVACQWECIVRDLVVTDNGDHGLAVAGTVSRVQAFRNGSSGIWVVGTVQDCASRNNGAAGYLGPGVFSNNIASRNGSYGFNGGPQSVFIGNRVFHSGSPEGTVGFRCFFCAAHNNAIFGVESGFDFEDTAGIFGGNVIVSANPLINEGSAVQAAPNICGGGPCP